MENMNNFEKINIIGYSIKKLLKKTEILEDGDTISLKFVPAENNKVVETLQIPEELQTT